MFGYSAGHTLFDRLGRKSMLYLSCVERHQLVLERSTVTIKSAIDTWYVMQQASSYISEHFIDSEVTNLKVTCSSVWLCCISSQLLLELLTMLLCTLAFIQDS